MSSDQEEQLKLFIDDIEIESDDPFKEDTLGRKGLCDTLTNLINAVDGHRTLALNGAWGSGKTTFLRMWQTSIESKPVEDRPFRILYFDAFRYDYFEDPLIAISGAIAGVLTSNKERFAEKAGGVVKRFFPAVLKGAAKAGMNKAGLDDDALAAMAAEISGIVGNEILTFTDQQRSVDDIKVLLEKEIKKLTGKKLVIVVDELDRCRPTFAVELLERIKHIFDVEGLVFLLAMNPDQMCETIRCIYGQRVDANMYLQKFVDGTLQLPQMKHDDRLPVADTSSFHADLLTRHGWKGVNPTSRCPQVDALNRLGSVMPITARSQRKIVQHLTAVKALGPGNATHIDDTLIFEVYVLLIAMRHMRPDDYERIKEG